MCDPSFSDRRELRSRDVLIFRFRSLMLSMRNL